jgi:hypothetical protein
MSLTAMTQVSRGGYWNTDPLPLISDVTFKSDAFGEEQTAPYGGEQSVSSPPHIDTLPDSPYTLRLPIPVRLERQEDQEWVASFEEAHISMSGSDPEEAMLLLAVDIESAFALFLTEEEALIPRLTQDFAVLRRYIKEG